MNKIHQIDKPILYAIDYCTGFITGAILADKTAESAARGLWKCWYAARLPIIRTCLSDNGKEFVGNAFEQFLQRFGTAHTTTAPYHPETN